MRWLPIVLAMIFAPAAAAGTVTFEGPDAGEEPRFSVYSAGDATGAAVARAVLGEPVELAAGTYVFGVESYPWRSAPFEVGETSETVVPLGAVRVEAPDGAGGAFGIFSTPAGHLVAPLALSASLYLPAGDYVLRRDLAAVRSRISVAEMEISRLAFGALQMTGPESGGDIRIFVAEDQTGEIAAAVTGVNSALALAEGIYRVASTPGVMPAKVEIEAGAVTQLPVTLIDWADRAAEPVPAALVTTEPVAALPTGVQGRFVVFGTEPLSVRSGDDPVGELDIAPGGHGLLWRLSDGRYPTLDGLPLALQDGVPPKAARGLPLTLVTELGARASVGLTLVQGDRTVDLGQQVLGAGEQQFAITVPEDLDEAIPVRVEISAPGQLPMRGTTAALDVHVALSVAPDGLAAAGTMPTVVELSWQLADAAGVAAIDVFRGDDGRPLVRLVPDQRRFTDIGLSAGRSYDYRVCTRDEFGIAGPCAETTGRTTRP